MLLSTWLLSWAFFSSVPQVPGGCTAPAAENVDKPGCFLSAEIVIERPAKTLYWHIHEFPNPAAAAVEGRRHAASQVTQAHGRTWLYVIGTEAETIRGGERRAVIGPMTVPADGPVTARFMESLFPPGMRTRVHSHSGPEAFFVVEGQQCVETPRDRHLIEAGSSYIVPEGAHMQGSREGRRSLVLILAPKGAPWMSLADNWAPTGFCQ